MNLILPIAGGSTRFGSDKPKFLLTHPSGNTMLYEAVRGLGLDNFKYVYVVIREDIYKKYKLNSFLRDQFKDKRFKQIIIKETTSQAHTVAQALRSIRSKDCFVVKDCDNFFKIDTSKLLGGNFICYGLLNEYQNVNAGNKSYISISENGKIENIVEKKVISASFCAGAYAFENPGDFLKSFETLASHKVEGEVYLSDIVFNMLLTTNFEAVKVNQYLDWGTQNDWDKFRSSYATYFVDIDGVLFKSSSRFTEPYWGTTGPLENNIKAINALYDSGRAHIILTTARAALAKNATMSQLDKYGVRYHEVIFGLPHAKRVVVNDFSDSNKYKTAESINIRRDSDDLSSYLWKDSP